MVNNLEKIKEILKFNSSDDFFHLQILKRKKENPELGSNAYVVKTYFITSIEHLEFHFPEMKMLCDFHNARACINLNKRSFEKCSFNTLKKVTDQIMNKEFKSTRKAFTSVCGSTSNAGKDEKTWIIDVDIVGQEGTDEISRIALGLPSESLVTILPTKNGWHLITKPFNLQEYKSHVGIHDIHKNNPTILYIP